ncbi:GAF domain-containing protein, partial [candidate division KSB1 bacterium]|nr:GAF domain-containing protein [candidate division KSB1 bacterium]
MNAIESPSDLLKQIKHLKAKVDDLSSLIQVSNIISSTFDLDELMQLVMEKAQAVMHAEASSVMLVNEERDQLECEVALGEFGDKVRRTIHLDKGQGVAGWVWEHERPIIVPDVRKDERFYDTIDRLSGFQT